jgi:hypothetical protein
MQGSRQQSWNRICDAANARSVVLSAMATMWRNAIDWDGYERSPLPDDAAGNLRAYMATLLAPPHLPAHRRPGIPNLFRLMQIEQEISQSLGVPVTITTRNAFHPLMKNRLAA